MYSARSSIFRQSQFDKQAARFVSDVFLYSDSLSTGTPCQCEIATLKSILVDWENTALINGNTNTALEDLVLDRIITE